MKHEIINKQDAPQPQNPRYQDGSENTSGLIMGWGARATSMMAASGVLASYVYLICFLGIGGPLWV